MADRQSARPIERPAVGQSRTVSAGESKLPGLRCPSPRKDFPHQSGKANDGEQPDEQCHAFD